MPLPIIEEGVTLDSFSTTNNGPLPLGYSTIYGASSEESTSIFSYSTNSTASNLPGPGRVLGNLYSLTGRRLERTLGDLAHKAGFSPEAIYQRICALYLENWLTGGRKASILKNLCFQLLKQTKSITDSTRLRAIMRWGNILRDQHEIYVWLCSSEQERMAKHASALLRAIEEFQSTSNTLSDLQNSVLCETSLLVNLHCVGVQLISLGSGKLLMEEKGFRVIGNGRSDVSSKEIEEWSVVLQHLLESLPNPTISRVSQWYIDLWSSEFSAKTMQISFALHSCLRLQSILKLVDPSHIARWDTLAGLCKKVYEYFVRAANSGAWLRVQWDDFLLCDGVPVHMSVILNNLAQEYNNVFSSQLYIVPDLTCITMLGSTDLISADVKEKIRGFLKEPQSCDDGKDKVFVKMMILRPCYRLLERAWLELYDSGCRKKLSKVTSFTDGTRRWAILQFGDILQTLPEVYMLLITLGGNAVRSSMNTLRYRVKIFGYSTRAQERDPAILIKMRLLLLCHAAGLWLMSQDTPHDWDYEAIKFIKETTPLDNIDIQNFRETRDLFLPYLMDNVTFNPMIFYLKLCISRSRHAEHVYKHPLLLCAIVQGALLKDSSAPQEKQSVLKELCRTMHDSTIELLRSRIGLTDVYWTKLEDALWSAYTDLTEARHVRTSKDEVEAYLLQLCSLLFDIILKSNWNKRHASLELFLFGPRNIFGWFLSRVPDAEKSISGLFEDIDDSPMPYTNEMRYNAWRLLHLEAHRSGVILLAPRHEKLEFEGAGLAKQTSTMSSEPPLTPQQGERWINAFKTLAANLRSASLEDISLFYFANCPLPYEADPMFDTALALDYCKILQQKITNGYNKEDLSRAVSHTHTCLTKRVEFVKQSCADLAQDEAPKFHGTPFNIRKVVKVVKKMAKLSKELCSDAPEPHDAIRD